MKNIEPFKAYKYFWYSVLAMLLLGVFVTPKNATLNIPLHDIYFVISGFHFTIFYILIFIILGNIYYLLRKIQLNKTITIIHTTITISSIIISYLLFIIINFNKHKWDRFDDFENLNDNDFHIYNYYTDINKINSILIIVFIICQLLFIFNITQAIVRKVIKSVFNKNENK